VDKPKKIQIRYLRLLAKTRRLSTLEVYQNGNRWSIEISYRQKGKPKKSFLYLKAGGVKKFSHLNDIAKLIQELEFDEFKVHLNFDALEREQEINYLI
jgi:hypothetical protein